MSNIPIRLLEDFNANILNYHFDTNISNFLEEMYCNSLLQHITSPFRITSRSQTVIENIFLLFCFWYLLIVFRRVSNLSWHVMLVSLIQYREPIGSFNCKKCVCANSSNPFSDKLFPKRSFQSLLGLLLTNAVFLSLLFFCLPMKKLKAKVEKIQILSSRAVHSVAVILLIHHIWLHGLMIKINGAIELNPESKQKQDQNLSVCHWNQNSIPIHNFQKLEVLQGYILSNEVDILCFYSNPKMTLKTSAITLS